MSRYSQYFALEKKIKQAHPDLHKTRAEFILEFTDNAKMSLKELSPMGYIEFTKWLNRNYLNQKPKTFNPNSPENQMRRKVIAILKHQMQFTMVQINDWCLKHGKHHKKLNDHNKKQLQDLVTQVEQFYQRQITKI